MARISRKELKSDKFAQEVGHTVEYVEQHRQQFIRYSSIALAAVVVLAGIYWYTNRQASLRERELSQALRIVNARVGPSTDPAVPSYPTQDAKDKEVVKVLNELQQKYPSSDEAVVGLYLLGGKAVEEGKLMDAEKYYKQVADSGNKKYTALGQFSLAQVYAGIGRTADSEKLLRSLMDHPTPLVSKETATLELARTLAKSKPEETRKLLEGLGSQTNNPEAARAAVALMGELFAK